MLAAKRDFTTPQLDCLRQDTGRIIALWRRPVASRAALDLLYWAMRSAPYRLIRMAIEMAREAGQFFSFADFMS